MIKLLFKNPFSIWLRAFLTAAFLMIKHRKSKLRVGSMSFLKNCSVGIYNTISDNVTLLDVTMGDFTYVSYNTVIKHASIGKFCSIGPNCSIGLGVHPIREVVSTHPIFYSTLKQAQICFADKNYFDEYVRVDIGHDVWIGENVTIVDGVSIGNGAVIAAGSVVAKDVASYAVMGGVPATIIRFRFTDEQISELLELKWWDRSVESLELNFESFHNIDSFLKVKL
jgi:acetyltransferase-like isoleucine patch superfamily enzyme